MAARTYIQAQKDILDHLRKAGWLVSDTLRVPHATNPDKKTRVYFKPQAVYIVISDQDPRLQFGSARSMHLADIRGSTPEAFMDSVGRWENILRSEERTAALRVAEIFRGGYL